MFYGNGSKKDLQHHKNLETICKIKNNSLDICGHVLPSISSPDKQLT
jgi:hypothetical protein